MKRLILLVALVMAMAVLAPAAFADDAQNLEGADIEMEAKEPSAAQLLKAQMIADYFFTVPTTTVPTATVSTTEETGCETSVESAVEGLNDTLLCTVLDLRAAVGWGAVFKLMMYAQATGNDPSTISPFADDGGYGFGNLFKDLEFAGEFTNLGQLQKFYRVKPDKPAKPEKARPRGQTKKSG